MSSAVVVNGETDDIGPDDTSHTGDSDRDIGYSYTYTSSPQSVDDSSVADHDVRDSAAEPGPSSNATVVATCEDLSAIPYPLAGDIEVSTSTCTSALCLGCIPCFNAYIFSSGAPSETESTQSCEQNTAAE